MLDDKLSVINIDKNNSNNFYKEFNLLSDDVSKFL